MLRQAVVDLARQKQRYGYRRLWAVLVKRGWQVNVKRVYRLYREEGFVEKMNAKAKELGLTHTFYKNCTGWPDPEQHMSVRDIATLAGDIIRTFPDYYHYDAEKTFKYNGIEQGNRNPMVQKGTADGLKTGHTDAGGFGLVASSKRNGRRVILVLNGMTSMRERAEESERLMDWAFFNFEDATSVLCSSHRPPATASAKVG